MSKKIAAFLSSVVVSLALFSLAFPASATDLTVGGTSELAARYAGKVYVVESQPINFATYNTASGTVHNVINVPAQTLVLGCAVTVKTASTDTGAALTVGDGSSSAGWVASTSLTSAGSAVTANDDAYGVDNMQGKLYSSADTIDITLTGTNATTSTGIVKIRAICVDLDD